MVTVETTIDLTATVTEELTDSEEQIILAESGCSTMEEFIESHDHEDMKRAVLDEIGLDEEKDDADITVESCVVEE